MNLSEVLDRSRELVRSRGLDPAFAAVQGVADFAVLYSHDRTVVAGIPEVTALRRELQYFLSRARSAQSLEIVVAEIAAADEVSELRLCARYREVLFGLDSYLICKNSRAKSYLVP